MFTVAAVVLLFSLILNPIHLYLKKKKSTDTLYKFSGFDQSFKYDQLFAAYLKRTFKYLENSSSNTIITSSPEKYHMTIRLIIDQCTKYLESLILMQYFTTEQPDSHLLNVHRLSNH